MTRKTWAALVCITLINLGAAGATIAVLARARGEVLAAVRPIGDLGVAILGAIERLSRAEDGARQRHPLFDDKDPI